MTDEPLQRPADEPRSAEQPPATPHEPQALPPASNAPTVERYRPPTEPVRPLAAEPAPLVTAPPATTDTAAAEARIAEDASKPPLAASEAEAPAVAPPPPKRRLMRSRRHHLIAGVAGGIADRMDTEPGLVRVLFLILALFTAGLALIAYIVLWVVTPLEPEVPTDATEHDQRRREGDRRMGGLVFGLLLVVAGAAWLLEATTTVHVDWAVVLALTLMGLGALLVLTLGNVARGLLLTMGVLLTVALATVSLVDINFDSSFGDRREQPVAVSELLPEYSHAFGSMTLDLRNLELPNGTTNINASTSFGSLSIILPPDVPVRVVTKATFGNVDALDHGTNGLRTVRTIRTDDYERADQRINLEVSASFGSVEVTR